MSNTTNTQIFSIDEHLYNDIKYLPMEQDLKWPFVGNQFNSIQWKSEELQDKIETCLYVIVCLNNSHYYIMKST